jgi:mono/diheme cytochrome c family protein
MRAAAGANPEATYTWLAANVFAKSCAGCHGAGSAAGKVDLSSYNAILTGPNQIVVAGNPAKSILFTVVNTGAMPKRAAKLPADQIQAISDWIAGGALNN